MIIHLCAENTRDGNPRRLYVQVVNGCIVEAWNEGYFGHHSAPAHLREQAERAVYIETTPAEYRRILKEYGN